MDSSLLTEFPATLIAGARSLPRGVGVHTNPALIGDGFQYPVTSREVDVAVAQVVFLDFSFCIIILRPINGQDDPIAMQEIRTLCKCAAIVGCYLTSVSCRPVSRQELFGKYVRTSSYGRETLELRSNGHYIHVFTFDGQVIHNTGSWELADDPGGAHVTLENFQNLLPRVVGDAPEGAPKEVSTGLYVERSLDGVIKIGLEEFGCFYKQSASP